MNQNERASLIAARFIYEMTYGKNNGKQSCQDAKCTPLRIMDNELKNYSKSVKSKCGRLPKNLKKVPDKEMRAHDKCTSKHYNESRYHRMDKKLTRCLKKNCNYDKYLRMIKKLK